VNICGLCRERVSFKDLCWVRYPHGWVCPICETWLDTQRNKPTKKGPTKMPNQPKPLPPICLTKNCRAIAVFFNDSDDRTGFCAECAKVLVDPATFGWEEEAA